MKEETKSKIETILAMHIEKKEEVKRKEEELKRQRSQSLQRFHDIKKSIIQPTLVELKELFEAKGYECLLEERKDDVLVLSITFSPNFYAYAKFNYISEDMNIEYNDSKRSETISLDRLTKEMVEDLLVETIEKALAVEE